MRVAVFASGSGTNLQALIDVGDDGRGLVAIALVLSNRAEAGAVQRAHAAHIPVHVIEDVTDGADIVRVLRAHGIELVVLAGYLKLVPRVVVEAFEGRMINIHPALLPSFGGQGMYGMKVHRAVLDSGATISGVTVHLVTAEYDRGPIIAQWPVPVRPDDTPETLQQRVLDVEHQLLPLVVTSAATAGGIVRLYPRASQFEPSARPASVKEALTASPLLVSSQ